MTAHPLPSLNVLRAFEAAARRGSFAAAAEELHVTASAVSQQVKTLERHLGASLFERHAHGIVLGDLGRDYAAALRPHLIAIDRATADVRARTERRTLRISMMPPLASRVVVPQLAAFQERAPEIEVHIESSLEPADLRGGATDLAIRFGSPPWPGCVHVHLADLHVQPVCPLALAADPEEAGGLDLLSRLPLIHMTERGDMWAWYFAEFGLAPPDPPQEFWFTDYPTAVDAAETIGAALALLPLERPLITGGRVVTVGPVAGPLQQALYAVMREEDVDDPGINAFLDWLTGRLQDL